MIAMSNTSSVSSIQSSRLEYTGSEPSVQRLRTTAAQAATDSSRGDQVEISADALSLEALAGRDVRTDLVARIRAEIASGTYLTDAKIGKALEGLRADLEG